MAKSHPEGQLNYIKQMMEMAHEYRALPSWQVIIGGLLCLVMGLVTYLYIKSFNLGMVLHLPEREQGILFLLWCAAFTLTVVLYVIITVKIARKTGVNPLPRPAMLAAMALLPAFLVGFCITLRMGLDNNLRYLPALLILVYGSGVYTAGLFSVLAPRVLGLFILLTGVVHMIFLPALGLFFIMLVFGVYHIVFGVYVLYVSKISK